MNDEDDDNIIKRDMNKLIDNGVRGGGEKIVIKRPRGKEWNTHYKMRGTRGNTIKYKENGDLLLLCLWIHEEPELRSDTIKCDIKYR